MTPLPLLTATEFAALLAARAAGGGEVTGTFDLGRSTTTAVARTDDWTWQDACYPYPGRCRDHTIYYWDGTAFAPAARFGDRFVKLVPTASGAPTFEIDGVKMLPSAGQSPWVDARTKVALVAPRGKRVLDTCGGLGYFAAWCLAEGAVTVQSFEANADVLWLRTLNPWSPEGPGYGADRSALHVEAADVATRIATLPAASWDAALHDPPRFALAGELYSGDFYAELARVLRPGARLFHYTGAPNSRSRGRDLAAEVVARLGRAGFRAAPALDGVLATRR